MRAPSVHGWTKRAATSPPLLPTSAWTRETGTTYPNDGSNSGDSTSRSVGNPLACTPGCSTTGAGVETNGVLVPAAVPVGATVAGGSTTWVEAACGGTFTSEVHLTVRSNVSGDVETVQETFPGLHFPDTRSTIDAGGTCCLSS